MMQGLTNKVAIVTGATKTMGATIARRLAAEGAWIVAFGRSAELGREVAASIEEHGGRAIFVEGDVTRLADVEAVVDRAIEAFGRLDIVVNNAAAVELIRGGEESSIVDEPLETFDRQLQVGLYGPFMLARAAIPHMLRIGGGAFVSLSSLGGHRAFPKMSSYGPTKAAIEAFDRQIATDYGPSGIRANSVVVGSIRVGDNAHVHDDPKFGALLRGMQMLPSVGSPDDIAAAVAFLASDEARFITGVALPVDGGVMAKGPMPQAAFNEWMDELGSNISRAG